MRKHQTEWVTEPLFSSMDHKFIANSQFRFWKITPMALYFF